MNFLSHHYVARGRAPEAPPAFYVGNVLPDLAAARRGGGRLRRCAVPRSPDPDLAQGLALHFATDKRFHTAALFVQAVAEASAALRGASWTLPPRRVFFLAHVFVEIALDAVLIRTDRGLADHLYAQFDAVDPGAIRAATETLSGRPLPHLTGMLARFTRSRYLYEYQSDEGLAKALHHISRRANLAGFARAGDRACLAALFTAFLPRAAQLGPALWAVDQRVNA
jgi:hypothetical protein